VSILEGEETPCPPNRCALVTGECLTECATSRDCSDGNACNADGTCSPSTALPRHSVGCMPGCRVSDRGSRPLFVFGALLARRRRPRPTTLSLTSSLGTAQLPYMAARASRTQRIELRAQPGRARRIRQAARLRGQSVSAFMLEAAGEAAEQVIASATTTAVPRAFFDKLWAALEASPKANAALAKRAAARRRVTQR
jgi:uncharacterized protein (DUF1778 family)